MSNSSSRRFPVTVTQLPVTRCQICRRTVAYRPGGLSEVLTEHYRPARPEALGPPFPVAGRGDPQRCPQMPPRACPLGTILS
jgi:hypothetical protein